MKSQERQFGVLQGKIAAITAAVLLFCFTASAQEQGKILHIAPGQCIFTYGRDTLDTNAFPAFYRALGADSLPALQRTAVVLAHISKYRSVEELDDYLNTSLQGIGLKAYAWFWGWIGQVADDRETYTGRKPKTSEK